MGAILTYAISSNPEKTILDELKHKFMLELVIDIIDKIEEKIVHETAYVPLIIYKEYFAKNLNQVLMEKSYFLLIDKSCKKGEALKFEMYCILIMLSKGSFETKINTIFNIFSINEDCTLTGNDFVLLIKSMIYSIFHLCKIPLPDDEEVKMFISRHFPLCLIDEYFELDYVQFYEWVIKSDDVHAFLMEFFEIQTRYNAMKTYIRYIAEFELIFECHKLDDEKVKKELMKKYKDDKNSSFMYFSMDLTYANETTAFWAIDEVMSIVGSMLLKIDPNIKTLFVELIDPDNTGYARKDRYMKAIKAICMFMSVDKDMSHCLSKTEIGTLIWLLSGDEPNESNLNCTLDKLDANGDSAIELYEWLEYLATLDHKGNKVINYTLKHKFDLFDEDGNGDISIAELEKMIIDSFTELINKAKGDNRTIAESVVRDLAKCIMNKMDDNNSNNLDWSEFKNYLQVASAEELKIADYIKKIVLS